MTGQSPVAWSAHAALPEPVPGRIIVTEQSSGGRLVVLEQTSGEDLRVVGTWSPRCGEGEARLEMRPESWGRPTEARLRRDADGTVLLLTCDSFGAVIVLEPQTGRRDWIDVGPDANPHAIELLPDGTIVVAASTGGWLRQYDPGGNGPGVLLAEFALTDAHGVWWDAVTEHLWALGGDELVRLRVEPGKFVRVATCPLPSPHGHDLQPVEDDERRLWLTTGSEVLQFDIDERTFEPVTLLPSGAAGDGDGVGAGVKSIDGGTRSGVLVARPSPGMETEWLTDRVATYHGGERRLLRAPTQLYKARKWEEII